MTSNERSRRVYTTSTKHLKGWSLSGLKFVSTGANMNSEFEGASEWHTYECAFCGEQNEVLADASGARQQQFTEDCQVCCRPNLLTIRFERDGWVSVEVEREYDA